MVKTRGGFSVFAPIFPVATAAGDAKTSGEEEERKTRLQTDQRRSSSFGNGGSERERGTESAGRRTGSDRQRGSDRTTTFVMSQQQCRGGEEGRRRAEEVAQCQCNRVFPYTAASSLSLSPSLLAHWGAGRRPEGFRQNWHGILEGSCHRPLEMKRLPEGMYIRISRS